MSEQQGICPRCGGPLPHEHPLRRGERFPCGVTEPHSDHIWVPAWFPHPLICPGVDG
jgi:hypothetical protein